MWQGIHLAVCWILISLWKSGRNGQGYKICDVAFCTSECSGQGEVSTWLQAAEDSRMLQSFGKKYSSCQHHLPSSLSIPIGKATPALPFSSLPVPCSKSTRWQHLTLAAVVLHLPTLHSLAHAGMVRTGSSHANSHALSFCRTASAAHCFPFLLGTKYKIPIQNFLSTTEALSEEKAFSVYN